jgi:ribonuclease H-related protein
MMNAEFLATRLANELTQIGYAAAVGPCAGDYGWKVRLQGAGGAIVVYTGKKGPRLVLTELQSSAPELRLGIQKAWEQAQADASPASAAPPFPSEASCPAGSVELWVDGSYVTKGGASAIGWAVLIVDSGRELYRATGTDVPEAARSQRNVAGEILAVLNGLSWCRKHDVLDVAVYHDYEGLEAWVTGRWQPRNPFTAAYARYVWDSGVAVQWQKVRAHTGTSRNEQVDRMAREAATAALPRVSLPDRSPAQQIAGEAASPRPSELLSYARHLQALASRWTRYGGDANIFWEPLQAALRELHKRFAPAAPLPDGQSPDPLEWARLACHIVTVIDSCTSSEAGTGAVDSPKEELYESRRASQRA